jgi:uncharacterized cupredoxin-like copper-binding protein
MKIGNALLAATLAAAVPQVFAHGTGAHAPKPGTHGAQSVEEKPFGRPGDPKKVTRTIPIEMSDEMDFAPNGVRVRAGETVRFVVRNRGRRMHELVLGTMEELQAHAELMRKHPTMEHDEPYMAHVAPGRTGTIVWQFTTPGVFYYGCLVPGHFEAGMIGIVRVLPSRSR